MALPDPSEYRTFDYGPNWSQTVSGGLSFRTQIDVSRSGREQRAALRNEPRRTIEFTILLNADEMRAFARLMAKWQNRLMVLADPIRAAETPLATADGTISLPVADLAEWMAAGESVFLIDGERRLLCEIDSVLDDRVAGYGVNYGNDYGGTDYPDSIVFSDDLGATWPVGTIVRPALVGRLAASVRGSHPTSDVVQSSILFSVDPGSDVFDPAGPGYDLLDGREVLARKPNWSASPESTFEWGPENVDYDYGRIATYQPIAFPTLLRRATYLEQDRAGEGYLTAFFVRQRGQRGEFLMPTWMNDLPLAAALIDGESTLTVLGTETVDEFADDPIYRALMVYMNDGRRIYREIESIVADSGNSVITLTSPWLGDYALSEIAVVCWMPVFRFATDQLTMQHLVEGAAQTQLTMRSLEYLDAESPITGHDGAAQSVLELWGDWVFLELDGIDYEINTHYPLITQAVP